MFPAQLIRSLKSAHSNSIFLFLVNYFQASWSIDKGIIDLLRIAHGCGEQNMIRFGPNVGIMRYLKQDEALTKREEEHLRQ